MTIKAEINEIESRKIEKVNKTNSWLFEKVNKIDNILAILNKKRLKTNEIRSDKGDIADDTTVIYRIKKMIISNYMPTN